MKKQTPRKHGAKTLKSNSKFNPLWALIIVVVIAATGVAILKASFAQSYSNIKVVVTDVTTSNHTKVKGVELHLSGGSGGDCVGYTPTVEVVSRTTNSAGEANFSCIAGEYWISGISTEVPSDGYIIASSSPYGLGDIINFNGTAKKINLYLKTKDTDKDGVIDNRDKCDTKKGPASNSGCPVPKSPVPPPPTAHVTPPPATKPKTKSSGKDTKTPTQPDNFVATPSSSGESVTLSWDKSSDNIGVVAYTLEKSTNQTDWTYLSKNIKKTSYKDAELDPETIYYYRLSAKDKAGNISSSASAYVTPEDTEAATDPAPEPKPPVVASTKKTSFGKIVGIATGGILLVGGLTGATMWWKNRVSIGSEKYDDQIREETIEHAVEEVSHDPDHPAHESESLKDMVMKDIDKK